MFLLASLNGERRTRLIEVLESEGVRFKEGDFVPVASQQSLQESQKQIIMLHEQRKIEVTVGRLLKRDEVKILECLPCPVESMKIIVKEGNLKVLFFDSRGLVVDLFGNGEVSRLKSIILSHCSKWKDNVGYLFHEDYSCTFKFINSFQCDNRAVSGQ